KAGAICKTVRVDLGVPQRERARGNGELCRAAKAGWIAPSHMLPRFESGYLAAVRVGEARGVEGGNGRGAVAALAQRVDERSDACADARHRPQPGHDDPSCLCQVPRCHATRLGEPAPTVAEHCAYSGGSSPGCATHGCMASSACIVGWSALSPWGLG